MTDAVAGVSGPVAALNLAALRYNALDMVVRSSGVPIRVASKSVRVRDVLDATLALPGYHGILAFTLPEALWLAETHDDVVLGYPSVDRAALAVLAADERAASRVTLMVDDLAQLDVVDSVAAPASRTTLRVAIDADASWRAPGLGHIGVRRSPVHEPGEVANLARAIAARRGIPPRGSHDVRSPDRRPGRCDRFRRRRHPLDAAPVGAGAAGASRGDRRRAARHRAARVRQRRRNRVARAHGIRSGGHRARPRAAACSPAICSTAIGHSIPRRRRRSRSRSCASRCPTSRRCSAAAGSPPGRPLASRQPLPVWPPG